MTLHKTEFWHGKRVLVTGHTGFKGSWLSLWLARLGAHVTGYALPPSTDPNLFSLARVSEMVKHVEGDVRNLARLSEVVELVRPEIVFHLAAQPLVRHSYEAPVETMAVNIMGTVNLLEAVRVAGGVRVVVCITSDKCYENREWPWGYRENEGMGGHDPYSSSKGCAELVISAYRKSYFTSAGIDVHGTALASARAGNVIGGGDWAKYRLIPDIIRAVSAGQRPLIRSPNAVRPWQHVLDPLSGYMTLAERLWDYAADFAEGWNFGPYEEDARPVEWIADRLCALWDRNAGWDRDTEAHLHEATWLKLDISKARQMLGWSPRWRLDDALTEIVVFNRALLQGKSMHDIAMKHISDFELGRRVDEEE